MQRGPFFNRARPAIKRFPSIQALRAIESVARNGALWRAAAELNVTRSAISHQLRLLETDLGFKILERHGNRTEITPQARAYAEDVRRALSMIASSTARVSQQGLTGRLTVSAPPGFASSWLCLHVGDFLAENPEVVLNVISTQNLADTNNPEVDTFITFGQEPRAHLVIEPLMAVDFTPLCSPAYLSRFKNFNDLGILKAATLIHMNDFTDWENWMQLSGLPTENAHRGICYSDMNIVHTAVLAGQGIAIGDTVLWRNELRDGKLMRPFAASLHAETGYFLCTPEEKLETEIVAEFRNWLKRRIELSRFRQRRDG
ncbi:MULTISPECIES: LysR substrate-binding domain-containing protein [unclassified Salipiger]|uniref:LysR substrate-binding domain-containing protein n=1 Tax=unclassified Salipiger TaxID=2640570 RepID=UPI0013BC8FA7|nr:MULTISPECIES: LysR substrate-binding domain-containing protein [unclassified Salipiger]NDV53605.1 LysR family transcriptional regulator [Salipiger sp. PrR003]NDW34994.1 LysR family transcriptional regulator [Salipiger sp. PrR007]